jgi:hypothetical protein
MIISPFVYTASETAETGSGPIVKVDLEQSFADRPESEVRAAHQFRRCHRRP